MARLAADLHGVITFVRDFQTLLAGGIALAAAFITVRPVWRQLERMNVQTNAIFREFLSDRVASLAERRKWMLSRLRRFEGEVSQRLYEIREEEGKLNIEWVFHQDQVTGAMISDLTRYQADRRDSAFIESAMRDVRAGLELLQETFDAIHRPHSTEQTGEDYAISDEDWRALCVAGEAAVTALDDVAAALWRSISRLDSVYAAELNALRVRIVEVDAALLRARM